MKHTKALKCRICGSENPEDFKGSFLRSWCTKDYYKLNKRLKVDKATEVIRVRKWRGKNEVKALLTNARSRCNKIGREFSIDEPFIRNLLRTQDGRCAISGVKFESNHPLYKLSIDRKDSTAGYTKSNVQLVILMVNYMKQEFPEMDFIKMCKKIARYKVKTQSIQSDTMLIY